MRAILIVLFFVVAIVAAIEMAWKYFMRKCIQIFEEQAEGAEDGLAIIKFFREELTEEEAKVLKEYDYFFESKVCRGEYEYEKTLRIIYTFKYFSDLSVFNFRSKLLQLSTEERLSIMKDMKSESDFNAYNRLFNYVVGLVSFYNEKMGTTNRDERSLGYRLMKYRGKI